MKTAAAVGLALSLVTAVAFAAGKQRAPILTKDQCDRLDTLWWQAEDALQQNGPCNPGPRRAICLDRRYDLFVLQIEIEQAMHDGKCERFAS
jgi:hypothetical protein